MKTIFFFILILFFSNFVLADTLVIDSGSSAYSSISSGKYIDNSIKAVEPVAVVSGGGVAGGAIQITSWDKIVNFIKLNKIFTLIAGLVLVMFLIIFILLLFIVIKKKNEQPPQNAL